MVEIATYVEAPDGYIVEEDLSEGALACSDADGDASQRASAPN